MKERICQIGALILGIIYSVKSLIHFNQDVTYDCSAIAILFLFVSMLFGKDNDEEETL